GGVRRHRGRPGGAGPPDLLRRGGAPVSWSSWRPGEVARRRITALALALVSFAAVLSAQRAVGVARDEVVYIDHGTRYARWWIDLVTFEPGTASRERITATFGGARPTDGNREHPPLVKTLIGLSRILLH